MKTMAWEKVYICSGQEDYEPEGRYRHEVGFDGRYIYILGGGTTEDAYGFETIPSFDTEKCVWRKVKALRDMKKGKMDSNKKIWASPEGAQSIPRGLNKLNQMPAHPFIV